MKKKLLLILIMLFPFFVNASGMYQELDIKENGDIVVKEAISLDGNYNGHELILKYKYFDENAIYSADSLELIKVCEASKKNPLDNVGDCFTEVSYANNGESLKYIYTPSNASSTIRMYNPSTKRKAFYVEYILKNVVVNHNDISELRLNMLDKTYTENLDEIIIKVNLPKQVKDLRGWAHGPLWGNIELDNDKQYILFTIDDYDAYTAIDVRMIFDNGIVTSSKTTNKDMLDTIIKEETILADAANKEREEAKKEQESRDLFQKIIRILCYILSGAWFIGLIIYFIYIYNKYDKEYTSEFNSKYFRDFPSNDSPDIVEYLMKKNVTSNAMSSCILNIIYKKGLLVEKTTRKDGLIFKKDVDDYILTMNTEGIKEPLTNQEIELRSWLLNSFGDGTKFNISELSTVSYTESGARSFLKKYNSWIEKSKKEAISRNFYYENSGGKLLASLYALIPIILIVIFGKYSIVPIILMFLGITFFIYVNAIKKRTKEGNELYHKWNALKNFLEDFGTFDQKELPEIALWEKYLVYASLFGIADKVKKAMEIKIPEISTDTTNIGMYDYILINNAINTNISTSVNVAVSSARSKIASSNSSSGGGFGGGFSGGSSGGGFSGGGGSGGGRF